MGKQTISKPPEGWRERINEGDQKIGYIARRIETWRGKSLTYSEIRDVLHMAHEYDEERRKIDNS